MSSLPCRARVRAVVRACALPIALAAGALALAAPHPLAAQSPAIPDGWPKGQARLRFEITVPPAVRGEPTTGRVYVMLSRTAEPELAAP